MTSPLFGLLRVDLISADFTVRSLTALWGEEADAALHRGHRVPARRALDARRAASPRGVADAAATLATIFVLGLAVSRADIADALPHLGIDGALDLGLIRADDTDPAVVHPVVDLRPYSFTDTAAGDVVDWWIASDPGETTLGGPLTEDHVLGVGGASLTLSGLMMHTPAGSVLDLGTGCGIQAMHASRHAKRVVATDISERALDYARMNAALNGIESIEFRLGSLFEPVEGERFDHIVSNPPFVITPRSEGVPAYEYRDGGRVGDALVAEVMAGAADHLVPGGIAQLLGNWEYRDGVDAFQRVRAWLDTATQPTQAAAGSTLPADAHAPALDAWIVEREVQDAPLYAETWIRDGGTRSGDDFDRLSDAWLDDFTHRGVTAVGFGYITLRSPAPGTAALRRLERLDGPTGAAMGSHIAATIAAHDWQASVDDEALARVLFTVAPDVTEERHYWPGDEHPTVMTLRQGGAFGRSFPLGTAIAAVVGACDGELSIAAICAALAELLDISETELLAEVLPDVRELVVTGFLTL